MLEKFRTTIRRLSLSAIGPSVVSLVTIAAFVFGDDLGWFAAGIVCFISLGLVADSVADNDQANDHALWVTIAAVIAAIVAFAHIHFSITRTTLLLSIIIWGVTLIDWICEKIANYRNLREEEANQKKAAEKQAFIDRINQMIGSAKQTKALIAAIERLTQYAPDEANHILGALARDAERYMMLRANQETSENEVLAKMSGEEADQIAQDARALCSDATEMALEMLREYQAAEAEERLGDLTRGSELKRASDDFRKYLRGLREVNEHMRPGRDENLRQKIDALAPQEVVKELPMKSRRRLRSGD